MAAWPGESRKKQTPVEQTPIAIAATVAAAAVAVGIGLAARAGGEKVPFPDGYDKA